MENMNANRFVEVLKEHKSEADIEKMKRYYKGSDSSTLWLGLHMRTVFQAAKDFMNMSLNEIEKLLESPYYEVRMGAVSIMDFQTKSKKTTNDERKALFELYIERHDRIDNWDFVDRAAPSVVGNYLKDKSKEILYELVRSENIWERRTAIVSTFAFIKNGDVEDTFRIAELLVDDKEELINKSVGTFLREAGKKDEDRLKQFLDKYATTMPRVTLRYAIEKLDKSTKKHYMTLGKSE
ncbi:DNA alkylation repair protein [Anaerobacillus alkalidiazotrophicus]|uniref:DNA alkylation repair protein n=1 Tax=Anaerobacillus alkalidiazotrophicus TaxID=472963 RepID=A0A1S2M3I1_9BACI|nr:DNA alkylation repair protein [Anaerobacillus alkalidiazotrophicus]